MAGRAAFIHIDRPQGASGGVGSPLSLGGEKAAEERLDVLHWCVKRASFYMDCPQGPLAV